MDELKEVRIVINSLKPQGYRCDGKALVNDGNQIDTKPPNLLYILTLYYFGTAGYRNKRKKMFFYKLITFSETKTQGQMKLMLARGKIDTQVFALSTRKMLYSR